MINVGKVVCVNLGCGNAIAHPIELDQMWINLDRSPHKGVDTAADLEEGLPFKDESVDLLYASHVLEHIKAFPALMRECYRVLKPRGLLALKVPAAGCRAANSDPTHVWKFEPETWDHFNLDTPDSIGFDTLGMRKMGFVLKWREVLRHRRPQIDDGKPGSFFTEIIVDLEKDGSLHEWEEELIKMEEARVQAQETEGSGL